MSASGPASFVLVACASLMPSATPIRSKADLISPTTPHTRCASRRYVAPGIAPRIGIIVFQALPHTLGLGPEVWRVLDRCHKLRNQSEYEGELLVDDRIVMDLITACDAVAAALDRLS